MPGKSNTTPLKMQKGTPSTPRPGQKILTGLSMGQKYHDDPVTLEKQFRHLDQFKPAMIKPFLSDVAHVYTDLLPKLLDSHSEDAWNNNLNELVYDSIINLYFRGQEWRLNMSPIFEGKDSGYGSRLAVEEDSSDDGSPCTSQESQGSEDPEFASNKLPFKKPMLNRTRSNSDMDALTSVDSWVEFDSDIRTLLIEAATIKGYVIEYYSDPSVKSLVFKDHEDFVDSESDDDLNQHDTSRSSDQSGTTSLNTSSDNSNSGHTLVLPSLSDNYSIKKNAYFKSIYLNMHVYYLQGRLLLINDYKKELDVSSDAEDADQLHSYDIINESLVSDLKAAETKLASHNAYLSDNHMRDPFHHIQYAGKKSDMKLAKLIANELLIDAEHYLSKHFKDKLIITRHSHTYKSLNAIKFSSEYMIKNFAVIGMYSIFNQFDIYHYPRKTTHALITFTNKFLNPIIKTLVNPDPSLPFDPMDYRDTSNVVISPYITTPIEIKEEFLADVSKTIRFVKEEWERGGSPEDMYKVLNQFKPDELSQISSVLMYWIDFSMSDFKKLSRRSILHLKEGSKESHDPQFEEALKNAKIVMKMLISCMRYSLPEEDYRFTKMISLYKKALRLFTLVLTSLNCDFSTDKLNVIVDEEVISRMRIFLGKIQDEKLALTDAYQILGEEFKDSQINELDQRINDTTFLIDKFGNYKHFNAYESEDEKSPAIKINNKERSLSTENEATGSDSNPKPLLIKDASMYNCDMDVSMSNRDSESISVKNEFRK